MSSTAPLSVTDLDKQIKLVELQIQLEKTVKQKEAIVLERVQAELKLLQTKERLSHPDKKEKGIKEKEHKLEEKHEKIERKKKDEPWKYPNTRRDQSIVETLHGVSVPDPYRWLEDPDSPETTAWVTSQNQVTNQILQSCRFRTPLKKRMEELWNFTRYTCPFKRGDKYYYFKNDGLQNQAVLYQLDNIDSKEEKVLLDPNLLSKDGTAALGVSRFSEDGKYYAYGVSQSGSDWITINVMKTDESREQLSDKLEWVKFSSISWSHDHKGFFYSRYPVPKSFENKDDPDFKRGSETQANADHSLYYHALGTKQDDDVKIYAEPSNPKWMMSGEVSDDGHYLVISINDSCDPVNRLFYIKIKDVPITKGTNFDVVKLIDNFEAEYSYITNEGSQFFFKTNRAAPRYKVISIDLLHPDIINWKEIIPHSQDVLDSIDCINHNQLIVAYLHDVCHVLKLYDLTGKLIYDKFTLPDLGTVSSIQGRKKESTFFYEFTSFLYPGVFYRFDLSTMTGSVFREVTMKGFEASQYETKQIRYKSKDGTEIPMFLIHSKNMVKNKKNPTFLYGYGGFNISLTPSFSVSRLIFIQHFNGVYALANLRGGGEYGEEWHQSGTLANKQNVFDDFIGAAEWLIDNDYTTPKKLAINGGSNGGLLVAACINQRPELFGAAVAAVGVLDMLRFHKFTIGYAWCSDYGSPDKPDEFKTLYAYSPLHNVNTEKSYPAVMLTTADHDDRVVPLHSYKYISELQHRVGSKSEQKNPLVIRIETKAGHGAGMPLSKRIQEQADILAFISKFTSTRLGGFPKRERKSTPKTHDDEESDQAHETVNGNGTANNDEKPKRGGNGRGRKSGRGGARRTAGRGKTNAEKHDAE